MVSKETEFAASIVAAYLSQAEKKRLYLRENEHELSRIFPNHLQ